MGSSFLPALTSVDLWITYVTSVNGWAVHITQIKDRTHESGH